MTSICITEAMGISHYWSIVYETHLISKTTGFDSGGRSPHEAERPHHVIYAVPSAGRQLLKALAVILASNAWVRDTETPRSSEIIS